MNWEFVEQIYVTMFRNLTSDGSVACSRTILELFPDLFMSADGRAESRVPQVRGAICVVVVPSRLFEYPGSFPLLYASS